MKTLMAPYGSPTLPGRQPHSANRLYRLAAPDRKRSGPAG
ncbi:hypothetical protein PANT111_40083 [Pantoea brenneri]|uniref:Uncharacterized protein n=1 Tax=Pantoea brenneri TaxID=472694 RepID=A0AAX3JAC1_9GAMM|nr:hypothetical protein PANT111_40083 [Pantoea brenneri]